MAWVRMDDNFPRGPKVKRAAQLLAAKRRAHPRGRVLAVWNDLMAYCGRHQTDGFFPDHEVDELPDVEPVEVLRAMATGETHLGPILERDDAKNGWIVRNYATYQPLKSQLEARKAEDARRQKEKRDRQREEKLAASGVRPFGRHIASGVPRPAQPHPAPDDQEHEDQEQPPQTSASHPSGAEKSTEDQFNATNGREVYSGRLAHVDRDGPVELTEIGDPDGWDEAAAIARASLGRVNPLYEHMRGENPAALTKIAHDVLADRDNGRIPALDVSGAVKDQAARAGIPYGHNRVQKALDSAEHRRQRDTPISAALRIAEEVLRQAPGLTLTVPEFHRAIFDRTAFEYGDVPEFADAVRALLYDPRWPKHDPDHFGLTDTLKDPDTGRRLLKPVVGAYHWRLT